MIADMEFWIRECNIDGFRCDMAHLVPLDFWRQARVRLDPIKPLFWLAETEDLLYLDAFDTCYAWRWMHHTEKFSKGQLSLESLADLLQLYRQEFPAGTCPLFFTANHDENSWNGTEYEKYDGAARPLAVFNATWFGIPLIYSGQELPNLKRLKFFDKDPIEWTGSNQLHDFYKVPQPAAQATPCHQYRAVLHSPFGWQPTKTNGYWSSGRRYENRQLLVLLNLSPNRPLSSYPKARCKEPLPTSSITQSFTITPQSTIDLKAWDYLVLR